MAIRPWEIERQRGTVSAPAFTTASWLGRGAPSATPVPITERFGVAGPSGALFRDRPQQVARDPRPSDLPTVDLRDLGSTGPEVDDKAPPAPTTAGVSGGPPYSATLPALTPEMQRALAERRRAATSAFGQQEEDAFLRQAEAQAANVFALNQLMEEAGREQRAGMEELAARGVARSPMFTNRFVREQARLTQERVGELDFQLASTLSEINREMQQAQAALEREYADIDFETAVQRSAVNRLMGIA